MSAAKECQQCIYPVSKQPVVKECQRSNLLLVSKHACPFPMRNRMALNSLFSVGIECVPRDAHEPAIEGLACATSPIRNTPIPLS